MALQNAQHIDARYTMFNDVGRSQYISCSFGSQENVLQKLKPVDMACSNRTGCLKGTRADVLALVTNWASNPKSTEKALWLYGPAGSGKSTISTTLADQFRQAKQLGAFLFFDRDIAERSNPALVTQTLAHQIGSFYPEIGDLIIKAIKESPQTLMSPIHSQFQELLIDPSIELPHTKLQIVLILDALDECGTTTDRKTLLDVLAEKSAFLPSTFRLVITSRPDADMRSAFWFQPHVKVVELDLTSTASTNDISTFFRYRMEIVRKKNRHLPLATDWPGKTKIYGLTKRACGLFVWASIVCNFIDAHDPRERLKIVLQNKAPTAEDKLDRLYHIALRAIVQWDDKDFVEDFRAVIGLLLFLRNPLTSTAIDNLLADPDRRPSIQIIEKLGCVVSSNPTVRFIHPSVADFLVHRFRFDGQIGFFVPATHNRNLAILCLRRLHHVFSDMSQLALITDKDGPTIPADVPYACVFWVDHICMITDDLPSIETLLEIFINQHILHWFEAMSLLKRFGLTVTMLNQLSEWVCNHHPGQSSFLKLVRYWWRFSREYEMCIQECLTGACFEELYREFQLIDVQEPLFSSLPTPNIFDLPTPSPPRDFLNFPTSRSSFLPPQELPDLAPSVSRSVSLDFRYCRPLSRSSLNSLCGNSSSAGSSSRPPSVRGTISRPPTPDCQVVPPGSPSSLHSGHRRRPSISKTASQRKRSRSAPNAPTTFMVPTIPPTPPSTSGPEPFIHIPQNPPPSLFLTSSVTTSPTLEDTICLSTKYVLAMHDFVPQQQDANCLSFHAGQVIHVLYRDSSGWWDGELEGQRGWFPSNYVNASFDVTLLRENLPNVDGERYGVNIPVLIQRGRIPHRPLVLETLGSHVDSYCPSLMLPLLQSISVLQSAVRATQIAHFEASTVYIISRVKGILAHTDCISRDSPLLKNFPNLSQERRTILADLTTLVQHTRGAISDTVDEGSRDILIEEMLKTAGHVFCHTRRFLAVAVQCGVDIRAI